MGVLFQRDGEAGSEFPPRGVGGWLAFYLGVIAFQSVIFALGLPSAARQFASAKLETLQELPVLGPLVVLEFTYPIAFIGVGAVGTWLTFKKRASTPAFWGWFLVGVLAYAVLELALVQVLVSEIARSAFSRELALSSEDLSHAWGAALRMVGWSAIWTWYWKDSDRVRATFGRNTWTRKAADPMRAAPAQVSVEP